MEKILWIIMSPKQETIIEFETSKFFKWVVKKLMKKRKIKIKTIKKNQLKGYKISTIYVDEFR